MSFINNRFKNLSFRYEEDDLDDHFSGMISLENDTVDIVTMANLDNLENGILTLNQEIQTLKDFKYNLKRNSTISVDDYLYFGMEDFLPVYSDDKSIVVGHVNQTIRDREIAQEGLVAKWIRELVEIFSLSLSWFQTQGTLLNKQRQRIVSLEDKWNSTDFGFKIWTRRIPDAMKSDNFLKLLNSLKSLFNSLSSYLKESTTEDKVESFTTKVEEITKEVAPLEKISGWSAFVQASGLNQPGLYTPHISMTLKQYGLPLKQAGWNHGRILKATDAAIEICDKLKGSNSEVSNWKNFLKSTENDDPEKKSLIVETAKNLKSLIKHGKRAIRSQIYLNRILLIHNGLLAKTNKGKDEEDYSSVDDD
jgi:hypothetical protein